MRSLDATMYLGDGESLAERCEGRTVVAIDVLRATTTLVTALANGAACAIPVLTPEDAFEQRATAYPDALLGGERDSVRIDGFDLANSPHDYTREVVEGRTIVFMTTNGTKLIRSLGKARRVLIGAFLNVDAVCAAVLREPGAALLASAGSHGRTTMEDCLCAGACVARLRDHFSNVGVAARACEALWRRFCDHLTKALTTCEHGANLFRLGFDEDLPFATQVNWTDVVPTLREGTLLRLPPERAGPRA